jgi:hypothetical protein
MLQNYLEAGFPYILWVFLPLVPSILIFLIFPNNPVSISGPLKGLAVNAGGAFAAYLILFILLSYPVFEYAPATFWDQKHRYWEVEGPLGIIDEQGQKVSSGDRLKDIVRNKLRMEANPEAFATNGTSITLRVVEIDGRRPTITLTIPEFGQAVIKDLKFESSDGTGSSPRTIHLNEPIFIPYLKAPSTGAN